MTTLTVTPDLDTASVLIEVAGAPSATDVYASSWPANVDSWAAAGTDPPTSVTWTNPGLYVYEQTPLAGQTYARRQVTGLIVGRRYRLTLAAQCGGFFTDQTIAAAGVEGIGYAPATVLRAGEPPRDLVYAFTATATSHYVTAHLLGGTGGLQLTEVDLDETPAGVTTLTRTDVNGTGPVRMLEGEQPSAGALVVSDYEAALTGGVLYTLTDGAGVVLTASTTLAGVAQPWLSVPVLPQLGTSVANVVLPYSASQDGLGFVHDVIDGGRVPTLAPLSARSGTLTVLVADHDAARAVAGVYSSGQVVQLRQPTHAGLDMYHVALRVNRRPDQTRWAVDVDYVEVPSPSGPLLGGLGWDFGDLADAFADFSSAGSAFDDFLGMQLGPA